MPFNAAWLIAGIGLIIAIGVWIKTHRPGPAVAVFIGGIAIMIFADPSILSTAAEVGKNLFRKALQQGINV